MKRSSNIKKIMIITSIIVFTVILITSIYFLMREFLAYKESDNESKELAQEVIISEENEENEEKVKVDWKKLEDINKDIVGWIKIEGTHIDYPILQDNTKLQYLTKSFNGKYNVNGSIFTINDNPFQDNETIVYGHNMKSTIMFSELDKYMKEDFFYEHSCFEIYTKRQNYKATVFSCYSINVYQEEKYIKTLNFDEKVEYYKKASKYSMENIGEVKKIIKLSTCSYLNNHTTPTNQRYYIVAKLEKID